MKKVNITIIGSGYVGLVSTACFAELGHHVTCLDLDKNKIRRLKNLSIPIYEPDLKNLIKKNLSRSRIRFTSSYRVVSRNNIFVLCVDTPSKKNGSPDLKNLTLAVNSIVKQAKDNILIILKSTVPLGTNQKISEYCKKLNKDINIDVCSNPEFLREGSAVNDFLDPDRIIIGANSKHAYKIVKEIYAPIRNSRKKIISMSIESAELTKYAANSFLATKISFINEIAKVAELSNANIHEIKEGLASDPRIGGKFLNAGIGFGGSCFPKDLKALAYLQKKLNFQQSIVTEALEVNNAQVEFFMKKIFSTYTTSELKNKAVAIWGLAFKPNTDDIREAPGIILTSQIATNVKSIKAYDPQAMNQAKKALKKYKNISYVKNKYDALKNSDFLIICTEWDEFMKPSISSLNDLADRRVFDGRNVLDRQFLELNKFFYHGVGI